jgi:FkbM family methyltransferase
LFKLLLNKIFQHRIEAVEVGAAPQEMHLYPDSGKSVESLDVHDAIDAYDDSLLEYSRKQWQLGDWDTLVKLDREQIQHHPDRKVLALLAAAGHLQLGNHELAKANIRLAAKWGCEKKLIARVLVSSVQNNVANALLLSGDEDKAAEKYQAAIKMGTPGMEVRLMGQSRMNGQKSRLEKRLLLHENKQVDGLPSPESGDQSSRLNGEQNFPQEEKQLEVVPAKNEQIDRRFSSDADIDDLISDLTPFFKGKQITYVDVGAYHGEILLKIIHSKNFKIREAHLFEPNPASYSQLLANTENLDIFACHTYNLGISERSGLASFMDAKSMTKRIGLDLEGYAGETVFQAKCHPLDELSQVMTDGRIDLLKIDVEGEEMDVLASAKRLMSAQKIDVIYIEVGMNREGRQQTYFGDIDAYMQDHGYRVYKIYEQKNEWIEDSPLMRRCNVAYMSEKFTQAHAYSKNL